MAPGPGFEDWDHIQGISELDAAVYASSPSSLRKYGPYDAGKYLSYSLTKHAALQTIADIRIVSQIRSENWVCAPSLIARYQSADNHYFIYIAKGTGAPYDSYWTFYRRDTGSNIPIGQRIFTSTLNLAINTFYKFRASFWTSEGHYWARLEWWNGSAWIKLGDDLSDVNNKWPSGGRCGLGRYDAPASVVKIWFDDTEIWG